MKEEYIQKINLLIKLKNYIKDTSRNSKEMSKDGMCNAIIEMWYIKDIISLDEKVILEDIISNNVTLYSKITGSCYYYKKYKLRSRIRYINRRIFWLKLKLFIKY